MKILLVNPYIYDFTAFDLWLRPLGLLYIASVLKKYTDCELYWLDALDRFQEKAFLPGDPSLKRSHADGTGKFHREIMEKPDIYKDVPRNYSRYGIPPDTFREKLEKPRLTWRLIVLLKAARQHLTMRWCPKHWQPC